MNDQTTAHSGLSTLEDISSLILQSHNFNETLSNIVTLVARRMYAEVCSIYLLDDDATTLWLRATHGLPQDAIGRVSMQLGEGLTSMALEQGRPVSITDPSEHQRHLKFEEIGEKQFHCFLATPLFYRGNPIGVIALQSTAKQAFSSTEISTISTIAFQISAVVVNAKLLHSIKNQDIKAPTNHDNKESSDQMPATALRGIVAYPGVVSGTVHVLDYKCGLADILEENNIDIDKEIDRLHVALNETRIQTLFLEKRVAERLSEQDAAIFHTHLMILEDRSFTDQMINEIRRGHSAPYALKKVISQYTEAFAKMDDAYLRERASDTLDIGRRLLGHLTGEHNTLQLKRPGILFAREVLPSDMATLDHEKLLGIVAEAGEINSHAVIMAKSLGIPALVAVKGALKAVKHNSHVILDGNSGCLFIDPAEAIIDEYRRLEEDSSNEVHRLNKYRRRPAISKDGISVVLRANIGLLSDVAIAQQNGANGVGLYRTEFPYMTRNKFPDRNDQYQLCRKIVESFDGPVTIRTLDIGGDKALPYFPHPKEDNPFMGWRSVRVSLDNRDIFRTQIEAILMAGVHGSVKLLFPMISGIEEIQECKEVIKEAEYNLRQEKIPFASNIPIGVMIEVPAAVQMCKFLAKEVDFFALGTNDLIQYMLAADRNNPLVNKYYNPLHPSILQAIKYVNDTAKRLGKGVCLCGEMASDPLTFTVLLGIGIREFSMVSPFIPRTKAFLADLSCAEATQIANEVLQMDSSKQILEHLITKLHQHE